MNGIIVVNKPLGKTSHDIVSFVRRLIGMKKVGHTGTLDPSATGVLPICCGNATKVCDMLTDSDKSYRVSFVLGMTTDTLDADGEVLTEQPVLVGKEEIEKTVKEFVGEISQIPPMYSAIKIGGKKLYELARAGIDIERKSRRVTIYKIDILDIDTERWIITMDVDCSKGTYIRTLCDDIGMKLGCGAYVNSLERRKSGGFTISESYTLDELSALKNDGKLESVIIAPDRVFEKYPAIRLDERKATLVKNGVPIKYSGIAEGLYRLYFEDEFLAVSEFFEGKLILKKPFWDR